MLISHRLHLVPKACALFSNSADKVHNSQANRNMEMTRERISFTFDPRDMLLSSQIGFSFVRAAVAYAFLRTSSFELLYEPTVLRYLKRVTVPSLCPFTLISLWMCIHLCAYTSSISEDNSVCSINERCLYRDVLLSCTSFFTCMDNGLSANLLIMQFRVRFPLEAEIFSVVKEVPWHTVFH